MSNDALQSMVEKLNREKMPMFSRTSQELILLSSQEDSPIGKMAWSILRDPALTARVLKIANGFLFNRLGIRVNTVSRAVLQLGAKTIKNICISSLLIENITKGSKKEKVAREMMEAFHAAVQARGIAMAAGDLNVEEVFISTLLYRIGHIAFWCFAEGRADELEKEIGKNPTVDPEKIEESVLGFTLQELTYSLVKEWGLGGTLEKSLLGRVSGDAGSKIVLLGHCLAKEAHQGWNSPRIKQSLSAVCRLTERNESEGLRLIKENTEEAIRLAKDYGLEAYIVHMPASEVSDGEIVDGARPKFNEFDAMVQLEVLSELHSMVHGKPFDLSLFLSSLLEGITRGVGMDRTLFAVQSQDKEHLVGRHGVGWDSERISRFRFTVKSSIPHVFSQVLVDKYPVWVNGGKTRYGRFITEEVKARVNTQFFFVAPVIVRGMVLGVVCADRVTSYRDLDAKSFNAFEYFMNTANSVLGSTL